MLRLNQPIGVTKRPTSSRVDDLLCDDGGRGRGGGKLLEGDVKTIKRHGIELRPSLCLGGERTFFTAGLNGRELTLIVTSGGYVRNTEFMAPADLDRLASAGFVRKVPGTLRGFDPAYLFLVG